MADSVKVPETPVEPPKPAVADSPKRAPATPKARRRLFRRAAAGAVRSVAWVVLLPFFFLKKRKHATAEEVSFYTVDRGFFLWLIIAAGWGLSALVHWFPHTNAFAGWCYAWVLIYLFLTYTYLCPCQLGVTDFVRPVCWRGSQGTGRFNFAHSSMAA